MIELSKMEKDAIIEEIKVEFPHDPALQQVYIAWRTISRKSILIDYSNCFKFRF